MGTRGLITFRIDGENKACYQQWDAYASGVGVDVLSFLRGKDLDTLKQAARDLKVVSEKTPPTVEQVEALRGYANTEVGEQSLTSWYCLLRKTHGDPEAILAAGYVEDSFAFGHDSLMCEGAVVVDLDAGTFEYYSGFNHGPSEGLWSDRTEEPGFQGYTSITRVCSFPLSDLPSNEEFLAKADPEDSE